MIHNLKHLIIFLLIFVFTGCGGSASNGNKVSGGGDNLTSTAPNMAQVYSTDSIQLMSSPSLISPADVTNVLIKGTPNSKVTVDNVYKGMTNSEGEVIISLTTPTLNESARSLSFNVVLENNNEQKSEAKVLTVQKTDNLPFIATSFVEGTANETEVFDTKVRLASNIDFSDVQYTYTYSIDTNSSNFFDINTTTGKITIKDNTQGLFDFETSPNTLNVKVTATNEYNIPKAEAIVGITVTNHIDNAPVLASGQDVNIPEDTANGTVVGTIATAGSNIDENTVEAYIFDSGASDCNTSHYDINSTTGIIKTNTSSLSYTETASNTSVDTCKLAITATNTSYTGATLTSDASELNINISNVIDNVPSLASMNSVTIKAYDIIGTIVAQATTNGTIYDTNTTSGYSIVSGNTGNAFAISSNGEVRVNGVLDQNTTSSYLLGIQATNSAGNSNIVDLNITVETLPQNKLPVVFVLVNFNDYQLLEDEIYWGNVAFNIGTYGTLNHYIKTVSYNQYYYSPAEETQGTANDGIITINMNMDHPGNSGLGALVMPSCCNVGSLVNAFDQYIDFASFDKDSDGIVSLTELQVYVIYAGGTTQSWDPSSHSSSAVSSKWGDSTVDGVAWEKTAYIRMGEQAGMPNLATIGVLAHELMHGSFSVPDLYDRDGSSRGVGRFCLMAGGSNTMSPTDTLSGQSPTHPSAWIKEDAGWVTPTVVSGNLNDTVLHGANTTDYNVLKIPTADVDEYFLLENRPAVDYDAGFYSTGGTGTSFDGGIALWHVDKTRDFYASGGQNDTETHKLVDMEEASDVGLDSRIHSGRQGNFYYQGNTNSVFSSTSTPNNYLYRSAATTSILIDDFSAVGTSSNNYQMTLDIQP